ncbi:MAG: hypothetical protein KAX09_10515 [Candidatus Heimdallarchaeota archaeon]|nr:hypothetical protein [Candidatus Heimdallarchaeota archaeon]MCK4291404.1 hypothetical protein [Candidatus Heimdallarchaeota archaeon]
MSTFGQVIRIMFWGCLEFNLLLLYLFFVFFPFMTISAMRRVHIKNKVKRKMIRNGMPRNKAKIYAKKYQSFLAGYGSIKGIYRISKIARGSKKDKEEETENIPEVESKNNHGSYTVV